jgi:uncharacterized protein with PhoU and TrkA domain
LLAVRRGPALIPNPAADMIIKEGDVVIVTGTAEQLAQAPRFFETASDENRERDGG